MKTNKKHLFGVAVILAAITFGFIACSDDGGGGGGGGGPTAQELANAFKEDYADALELTVGDVDTNDEAKVTEALKAYEELRADVKVLLTEQKALLDSLKEEIERQKEEIEKQKAADDANAFKADNAYALELTTGSVETSDQEIINKALAAYELLSNAAKALLTTEKALLDSLKEKIIEEITVSTTITNADEWSAAITQIANGGNGTEFTRKYYVLTIGGDFAISSPNNTFGSAAYINVTLNGEGTISKSSGSPSLRIGSNQTLVIDSEKLILQGRSEGTDYSVVYAIDGSQVELRNGTITGNTTSYGGGLYIDNAAFIMSGGNITDNTASGYNSRYGGGVYVTGNSSTFIMSGGDITGNTNNYGGGVHVNSGTFIMSSGNISNNAGRGVYVSGSSSTFTMSGGTITGNTTTTSGGGVNSGGTFTMNGGTISENKVPNTGVYGGGVSASGTFIMNGGIITGNTTSGGGGGVYFTSSSSGTFTMNGGSITGNESTSGGGGVYLDSGTFIMNKGSIIGNKASNGGGVVNYKGTFTMNDGSISKNTATGTSGGGGVFNRNIFTMNGGSISENEATINGGGVYIYNESDSKFTMSGGSIISNISNNQGGGVWVGLNSVFTKANNGKSSGVINSNTATIANGQQVFWNYSSRYRNDPLNETDELSTTNTSAGWSQ